MAKRTTKKGTTGDIQSNKENIPNVATFGTKLTLKKHSKQNEGRYRSMSQILNILEFTIPSDEDFEPIPIARSSTSRVAESEESSDDIPSKEKKVKTHWSEEELADLDTDKLTVEELGYLALQFYNEELEEEEDHDEKDQNTTSTTKKKQDKQKSKEKRGAKREEKTNKTDETNNSHKTSTKEEKSKPQVTKEKRRFIIGASDSSGRKKNLV